jgi:hypothetical protein
MGVRLRADVLRLLYEDEKVVHAFSSDGYGPWT